jgi:hypothetical protein
MHATTVLASMGFAHTDAGGTKMARDILGLGGPDAHVKNLESNPAADHATDEQERRRQRMSEGADEVTAGNRPTAYRQSDGATGIDMGAGGDGTDIE